MVLAQVAYIWMVELYVKNMVCQRCIKVVRDELEQAGVAVSSVQLGLVHTATDLDAQELQNIREKLAHQGFELIDDKKTRLIE